MDNAKKNNRRISIVLNGKEKSFDELRKLDEALLNQEISATQEQLKSEDEFTWVLPEVANEPVKEKAKVVDIEDRRRDKKQVEQPFWDDGKRDLSPKLPANKRKKRSNFHLKSLPLGVIGIILSAVIVGLSFGFMMKTIFTGEKATPATVPVQAPLETPVTAGELIQAPTLAVEIVQGGAFSTEVKGQESAQAIREKGFAATLSNSSDKVYLFIGLGLDKDQATIIGNQYKENGQDVYLKPFAVTSTAKFEADQGGVFLQENVRLFEKLALFSINGFADGGTLLTEEAMKELTKLQGNVAALNASFSENEQQQQLATMFQESLLEASNHLVEYTKTKDSAFLWKVQQTLLSSLITYEELLNSF